MKTIQICKARSVIESMPVESATLIIDQEVPECATLDEYATFYDNEADRLVKALGNHLPQGLLDRVLGKLMLKRASLFVIPMFKEEPKGGDAGE